MGLGDLLKRFSRGSGGSDKPAAAPKNARMKGGKALPPIPAYLKKDKFLRDAESAAVAITPDPPEEVAETGSFKKPGAWLKSRLGGVLEAIESTKGPNNIEKTKRALKKTGSFNDEEIRDFLSGLLDAAGVEEESAPSSESPPAP